MVLGKPAREGESPHEIGPGRQDQKYHETRGTLWEVGGPPPRLNILLVTDNTCSTVKER